MFFVCVCVARSVCLTCVSLQDRGDNTSSRFLCDIVLAFIDSCIAWWISFTMYTHVNKHAKLKQSADSRELRTYRTCKYSRNFCLLVCALIGCLEQ